MHESAGIDTVTAVELAAASERASDGWMERARVVMTIQVSNTALVLAWSGLVEGAGTKL